MSYVKCVKLSSPSHIAIQEVPYPKKKSSEVLIRVESVGICGSDIGAYRGVNPLVTYPRIIGHEIVGRVIETGDGMLPTINLGDRVIIDPYIYCGSCYPCSIGRTNCCEQLKVIGVHIDGGMQEVISHPAHMLHKVPETLSVDSVPLAEPLTIALHAIHQTKLKNGEHVVIIGAGAIGVLAALAAMRKYEAIPILVDIVDTRLQHAKNLGVSHVINAKNEDVIAVISKITNRRMAEVVIEASGANASIQLSLELAAFSGRIALTGWPKTETPLKTNLITYKELTISGSRTSVGEFDEALTILSENIIKPSELISKVVSLGEIPALVKELSEYPEKYLKVNAVIAL
ncbi:alcohol dehydrogenase catalytic domain-containing protein [Aeromonas allosaccharophila]|uniref:alcohol dehydrogenase catalytic domain-containing protein n=1 Tax=Aeromonas allosaccharophila TaxID=656 RepID=UPI0030068A4D